MSEEEAVASMEDVDTIAQRILQEEVPGGIHPPRYPNPPQVVSGSPAPAVTPKKDWRKPVKCAVWVLALLVAGGMLFNRFAGERSMVEDRAMSTPPAEQPAVEEDPGRPGIRVGPDGIFVESGEHEVYVGPNGIQVDGDSWDEAWEWDSGGFDYCGETFGMPAGKISEIEIEWISGQVQVFCSDSSEISFWEESTKELTAENQMVYTVKGGTLSIEYQEGKMAVNDNSAKLLTLYLPADLLDSLQIDTVSAGVLAADLNLNELDIETVSGSVILTGLSARELDVQTVSGDVQLYAQLVHSVGVDTTSGDFYLEVVGSRPSEIEVDTISGDATLSLPAETGFTLEFETGSGDLDTGSFQVSRRNGAYTSGDGSCMIEVDTTSGDLTLIAQ